MKTSKLIAAMVVGMTALNSVNAQELKMSKAKFNCWVYKNEGELIASGSFQSLGDSTISIMPLNQNIAMPYLIPISEIGSISFRKKGRVERGVLIGSGIGGLFSFALLYSAVKSSSNWNWSQQPTHHEGMDPSVFIGGFTIAGALIGALIGSQKLEFQINRKQNRYQRQKEEIRMFAITQ